MLLVSVSCISDNSYTEIDFTDTVLAPKPPTPGGDEKTLRVAVAAMISPKQTYIFYKEIVDYLGETIDMDIQMLQRKTYKEINEMFLVDKIDLAFICSGPYALEKEKYHFKAVVTPVVRGSPFYQSYLIVNKKSHFRKLSDLKSHTFAFSDPDSNTGSLVPTYWLHLDGTTPELFFRKTHFTYSHDNSILTVAKSLVDAAAVDGHKWEYFMAKNDTDTLKTRVIRKSEKFGSPPLVVSDQLSQALVNRIQHVLLSMHVNDKGKNILDKLLIDRFEVPDEEWYKPIKKMKHELAR